ncbi:MAG: hypothetical protein KDJ24_08180 [Gammaproteobacteria bacterium]|nr:hypothetical protein [Gammaproteobacteria bacterium]
MFKVLNCWVPAAAVVLALVSCVGGCAREPRATPPSGPPPAVELGAALTLLPLRTSHDRVATLLDSGGSAHVLIAAADTREVHHVVVSPAGDVRRERVVAGRSPASLSAAFDRSGRLHLLLGDDHFVRDDTGWTSGAGTPWQGPDIAVRQARLLPYPDGLVWAFVVDGSVFDVRGRWDWFVVGGAYAAVVFPWFSASEKFVLVVDDAPRPIWYLLDPQDNRDVRHVMSAADASGVLHVVYGASRTLVVSEEQPRYVQLRPSSAPVAAPLAAHGPSHAITLYPLNGERLVLLQTGLVDLAQTAFAVAPEGGTLLLVRAYGAAFLRASGTWSPPLRLPLAHFSEPRLAPAGGDAFHLMAVDGDKVLYLLYTPNGWSTPVEVGETKVSTLTGRVGDAVQIASAGQNRAFLVWPGAAGIVGRWIEGAHALIARVRSERIDLGDGNSIPKQLLDFARGQATLATPAWAHAFTQAEAAGAHLMLARQLHDDAQWETLARVVLDDGYGDDLRWYFLGRAAEGLALCDAAEAYYAVSQTRSQRLVTRCWTCAGLQFPQVVEQRMRVIGDMRTTGRCLSPPQP